MKDTIDQLLRRQWAPYESFVSSEKIAEKLSRPQQVLPEPIQHVLPNIKLAADGPIIDGVFIFTAEFMAEVRLRSVIEEFDFTLKNTIINYRFELGTHRIVRNAAAIETAKSKGEASPEPDIIAYQQATVTLVHIGDEIVTELSYFGDKQEGWLEALRSMLPVSVLKERR